MLSENFKDELIDQYPKISVSDFLHQVNDYLPREFNTREFEKLVDAEFDAEYYEETDETLFLTRHLFMACEEIANE